MTWWISSFISFSNSSLFAPHCQTTSCGHTFPCDACRHLHRYAAACLPPHRLSCPFYPAPTVARLPIPAAVCAVDTYCTRHTRRVVLTLRSNFCRTPSLSGFAIVGVEWTVGVVRFRRFHRVVPAHRINVTRTPTDAAPLVRCRPDWWTDARTAPPTHPRCAVWWRAGRWRMVVTGERCHRVC